MNTATGDMYDFVTHTWNPLNGECPHRCSYCYAKHTPAGRQGYYSGPLRLNTRAMTEPLGKGRTIFVCSLNDLFAEHVPFAMIEAVLERLRVGGADNTYLFQTKNPIRYQSVLKLLPPKRIVGCTIESTGEFFPLMGDTPHPFDRRTAMMILPNSVRRFVTIEPIMDIDVATMTGWLRDIAPEWVAIGADSKGSGCIEPTAVDVLTLIESLRMAGIEVRQKPNLARLLK